LTPLGPHVERDARHVARRRLRLVCPFAPCNTTFLFVRSEIDEHADIDGTPQFPRCFS
jgi:hypothetical protein